MINFFRKTFSVLLCVTSIALIAQTVGCGEKPETAKDSAVSKREAKDAELSSDCDWPMFGRTPEGNRIAPEGCGPKTDDLRLKWEFKIPGDDSYTGNYVISGNNVFMATESGKVCCLDDSDLSLKWEFKTDSQVRLNIIIDDNKLYFATEDKKLYCVDAKDGKRLWQIEQDVELYKRDTEDANATQIKGSFLYIQTSEGSILCLDKKDGKIIWVSKTDGPFYTQLKIVNDKIYYWGYNFVCLDAKNGKKIWEFNEEKFYSENQKSNGCYWDGGPRFESLPVFSNGKIYMDRTLLFKVFCLNADNGKIIWQFDSIGWTHSFLFGNKLVVKSTFCQNNLSDDKSNLHCLDAESGMTIWENNYNYSEIHAIDNELMFLSTYEDQNPENERKVFRRIDVDTSKEVWNINLNEFKSLDVDVNDKILYVWKDKKLISINLIDGKISWEKDYSKELDGKGISLIKSVANQNISLLSNYNQKAIYIILEGSINRILEPLLDTFSEEKPMLINNKIILTIKDNIYFINLEDGKLIWVKKPYIYQDDTYIATSEGKVYAAFDKLYCLEVESGKKIWEYSEPNEFFIHSPAISNGKLYAASDNKKLYCLDAATGEKIWIFNTNAKINMSPIVSNRKMYITTFEELNKKKISKMICIDSTTSAKIWEYSFDNAIIFSPVISAEKIIIATSNSTVICLDNLNGKMNWRYYQDCGISVNPTIYDDKVFFGTSKSILCLSIADGEKVFENKTEDTPRTPILSEKNLIYYYTHGEILFCYDYPKDKYLWEKKNLREGEFGSIVFPAISNERYYLSVNYTLYSVKTENGYLMWQHEKEPGDNHYTDFFVPNTVLSNGKLLLSSPEGKIYCFGDAKTNKKGE